MRKAGNALFSRANREVPAQSFGLCFTGLIQVFLLACFTSFAHAQSQQPVFPFLEGIQALQRTTGVTHQKADGSQLSAVSYQYDAAGQLASASETGSAGVPPAQGGVPASLSYQYDNTGQLLAVTSTNSASFLLEGFSYDSSGNRLTSSTNQVEDPQWRAPGTKNYTIAPGNRITSDGTYNYAYDDEGNVTSKTLIADSEQQATYMYDFRNRLVEVDSTLGQSYQTTTFGYDYLDRRVWKQVSGATNSYTQWYYNGDMIWREDHFGQYQIPTDSVHYLCGEGLDQWLARQTYSSDTQVGQATLQWFLTDRMGSVQAVTDKDGSILESYSYSAFGQRSILNSSLSIPNSLGFTGREHDPETGLTYYRARYMDPVLGRFQSEDPIADKMMMARQMTGTTVFDMLRTMEMMKSGQSVETNSLPTSFSSGDYNLTRYVYNSGQNFTDTLGLTANRLEGGGGPVGEYLAIVERVSTSPSVVKITVMSIQTGEAVAIKTVFTYKFFEVMIQLIYRFNSINILRLPGV